MSNNSLPSLCSAPWFQIHSEPNGTINPCCYYDIEKPIGNWNDAGIMDIYNSDNWNKLRSDFLDGKKPAGCSKCWKEESAGVISARQRWNNQYKMMRKTDNLVEEVKNNTNTDGSVKTPIIGTVDLIYSNLCNLSCRSCGPQLSTGWYADTIKYYGIKMHGPITNGSNKDLEQDTKRLVDAMDPHGEIHFSGGEPLMHPEHYDLLKYLIENNKTDVYLRYNTNLTVFTFKGKSVFEILEPFNNVILIGSIDAMGEQGEYIRKGFEWDRAIEWVKTAQEKLPKARIGISTVYSLLNSYAAIDLCKYLIENKLETGGGYHLNMLHTPDWYHTSLLPKHVKEELRVKIDELIEWINIHGKQNGVSMLDLLIDHWTNARNLMMEDPMYSIDKFWEMNIKLDEIRNEKFQDVFPELYEKLTKP